MEEFYVKPREHVQIVRGEKAYIVAKALGSQTRFKIVELLAENGELTLAEISRRLGLGKAVVSAHIKILETAGIVEGTYVKKGRFVEKRVRLKVKKILLDLTGED